MQQMDAGTVAHLHGPRANKGLEEDLIRLP